MQRPTAEEAYLDRYLTRTHPAIAPAIQVGAEPPETWTGTPEGWDKLAEESRRGYRAERVREFCLRLADGWRPSELADGVLSPGAQVSPTGRVVRPAPSTISPELESEADTVLQEMRALRIEINPVLMQNLEHAALGVWRAQPGTAAASVDAARTAIATRRAELQEAANNERANVTLHVRRAFDGLGRKHYAVGQHRLSRDEAAEIRLWAERMQAEATGRGWDAPAGYGPETWPPFEFERRDPV